MTDLVDFLRARLDQDEAKQQDDDTNWHDSSCESVPSRWRSEVGPCDCGVPRRVLADVAAKREMIDEHLNVNDGDCGTCVGGQWGYPTHGSSSPQPWPCATLRQLALPYADHPDYQQEWKP